MMTFTMSIVIEQKQGTLLRLRVAPLGKMHILGGKGLACFLSCVGTACILLLVGVTCLGVRVSSWPYVLTSIAAMAVCFSGLMMLLSVLGRTEQAVGGSALAIMLVMATLSRSKVITPRGYTARSYGTALSVKVTSANPNVSSATWSSQRSSVSQRSRSSRITRPPRRGMASSV